MCLVVGVGGGFSIVLIDWLYSVVFVVFVF